MEEPTGEPEVPEECFDRFMESTKRGQRYSLVSRRIDGLAVVDLAPNPVFRELPPHRKLMIMVLLLLVKDRGCELHFEPYPAEAGSEELGPRVRMLYKVDDELIDLVPPPHGYWLEIQHDIEEIAGLSSRRRRIADRLRRLASRIEGEPPPPRFGSFLLGIGDETLATDVAIWPSEQGDRVFLRVPVISEELSWAAQSQLKRVLHLMDAKPDPDQGAESE